MKKEMYTVRLNHGELDSLVRSRMPRRKRLMRRNVLSSISLLLLVVALLSVVGLYAINSPYSSTYEDIAGNELVFTGNSSVYLNEFVMTKVRGGPDVSDFLFSLILVGFSFLCLVIASVSPRDMSRVDLEKIKNEIKDEILGCKDCSQACQCNNV